MLDLLQENEKFRSHAKAIVDNRQRTIECSKRSDTFDLFYAIEYCAALLVLRKEVQAKQAFSDFMRRAQSLFIKNRQRIFEESLDFEQRDVRSITYLCHLIDMSGFVALLTQNNEWIDAIDECLVEGEFVSPDGAKVYDGTFRLLEYSIKLNRDSAEAARFRSENWDEWEEFDEVVDYDIDWLCFVAVENRDLGKLLDLIVQDRIKSTIQLENGRFHPYTLSFTNYVLGYTQAFALQMLKDQQKPGVKYPTFGINLLL
ncbi:MAG: hypothetical protein P8101_15820 [Candidatus Thiodiazotropha sp.]|jgi:hypothetical protein